MVCMELPFLKKKNRLPGAGMIKRVGESGSDLMDHVADELLEAYEKKDLKAFHEALNALCLMIIDQDKQQDIQEEL